MGETREQRINQFHEENSVPVVGLPEGCMLRCMDNSITLCGGKAILFQQNKPRAEYPEGSDLSFLLQN